MNKKRKINKKLGLDMNKLYYTAKLLIIILSVCVVSGFLVCVDTNLATAYSWRDDSGLGITGLGAGYGKDVLNEESLPEKVGKVIGIILAFVGILFLILMIYGGYIWMMARGNEQETEKAKSIIQNALIGIVVVLTAYAITYLVSLDIFTVT